MNWSWLLPEPVSTFGSEIDSIYYLILVITAAIFVLVEVGLIVFLLRYRRREGRRAEYSHGNMRLEIIWTVVPFVLVMLIAWKSMSVWLATKVAQGHAPADALPLRVTAKQFEWNVTYPGPDERLDTDMHVRKLQVGMSRPGRQRGPAGRRPRQIGLAAGSPGARGGRTMRATKYPAHDMNRWARALPSALASACASGRTRARR